MTRKLILLLLILTVSAACQPEQSVLPTRARLVTATDAPPPTQVGQTVFDPTATATDTAIPTETPTTAEVLSGTASATITPTITYTPSPTITVTPSQTFTPAPTIGPDERPLVALAFTALAATVLPSDYEIPGFQGTNVALTPTQGAAVIVPETGATLPSVTNCPNNPPGGFGSVYQANPTLATQLGCPLSSSAQQIPAAQQRFERGTMLWLNGEIVVLLDVNSALESYPDTFTEGVDPEASSETAPAGLYTPIRGFLKVWSSQPTVRNGLGWATATEQGATATVLNFDNGRMIWLAGTNQIYALLNTSWRSYAGTF